MHDRASGTAPLFVRARAFRAADAGVHAGVHPDPMLPSHERRVFAVAIPTSANYTVPHLARLSTTFVCYIAISVLGYIALGDTVPDNVLLVRWPMCKGTPGLPVCGG